MCKTTSTNHYVNRPPPPPSKKNKNVPVLRNSAHVILSRCDWLWLVSSSRTVQWGGAVVCVRLVRRYISAAMRDEEEKSLKTNQRRVNVRVRERTHRCHRCLLSFEGLSGLSSGSEWGRRRPSSLTPQAPGRLRAEGMLRTPERGGWLMFFGGAGGIIRPHHDTVRLISVQQQNVLIPSEPVRKIFKNTHERSGDEKRKLPGTACITVVNLQSVCVFCLFCCLFLWSFQCKTCVIFFFFRCNHSFIVLSEQISFSVFYSHPALWRASV